MVNLAFKALTLIVLIPVWLVLALLVKPEYGGVTLQSVLLAVPAVVIGFGISFLLGAAITCVAFWTTRVYSLGEFYWAVALLFSGQFVPLELMPPFIQATAQYLPFQLFKYFPIQLILNKLTPQVILRDFAMGFLWLGITLALFLAVWRAGLKRFSAVGA
jgi:ABC-2 type transport system permease protein